MDPQQRHLLMSLRPGAGPRRHRRAGRPAGSGWWPAAARTPTSSRCCARRDPDRLPDSFQLALHHDKDFLATKVAYHLGPDRAGLHRPVGLLQLAASPCTSPPACCGRATAR